MLQKHEAMPPTNFSFNVEMMPKQIRFSKIANANVNHTVQVLQECASTWLPIHVRVI